MWFHKEEETTTAVLLAYVHEHKDEVLTLTFAEGDSYRCVWSTDYESMSDAEEGSPEYDEYQEAAFEIVETLKEGPNHDSRYASILLTYKHFPILITSANGSVIYEQEGTL